jgi:hypothetical protein
MLSFQTGRFQHTRQCFIDSTLTAHGRKTAETKCIISVEQHPMLCQRTCVHAGLEVDQYMSAFVSALMTAEEDDQFVHLQTPIMFPGTSVSRYNKVYKRKTYQDFWNLCLCLMTLNGMIAIPTITFCCG